MTRDQLTESLLHLPHPWPRIDTDCPLPTENAHGDLEGWIKGPTNNEWHYAWIGNHERRIVITREQWEEALLAHVQRFEQLSRDGVGMKYPGEVKPLAISEEDHAVGAAMLAIDADPNDVANIDAVVYRMIRAGYVPKSHKDSIVLEVLEKKASTFYEVASRLHTSAELMRDEADENIRKAKRLQDNATSRSSGQ